MPSHYDDDTLRRARELVRRRQAQTQAATTPSRFGTSTGDGTQVAAPENSGSRFGIIGDIAGKVGNVIAAADKPLSERLGIRVPDDPLFLDEVANLLLEELSRPSTLAIAAGGAGLAPRIASTGVRGSGLAAGLVAPAGGSGLGSRLAAETALSVGGRATAETVNDLLPESTPTAARIALGLATGVAGASATLGATRSSVRAAVGRDILQPPSLRGGLRVEPRSIEVGVREGRLLNLRGAEQLGDNYSVKDVIDNVARRADQQVEFQATRLVSGVHNALNRLGKIEDVDGHFVVRGIERADGTSRPAYLETVLEYPDRFVLDPDKLSAVREISGFYQQVRNERELFNVPVRDTALDEGQNYIHRRANLEEGDKRGGVGTHRLRVARDRSRVYADPDEAIENGIRYVHPLEAFEEYTRSGLSSAANQHVASLLHPFSETSAVRVSPGLRVEHDALVQRLQSTTRTAERLDTRVHETINAYLNAAEPDLDNLLIELDGIRVGANAVGVEGRNFGKDVTALRTEIDAIKQQIRDMRPQWRKAVQDSKNPPPGRRLINANTAPALAGRDFLEADAKAIEKWYSRGQIPPQLERVIRPVQAANRALIPLRATGDLSATLNQLAAFFATNPVKFIRNFAIALKDAINFSAYERYLVRNGEDGAAHGLAILGRNAADVSDYQFGNWIERVPGPLGSVLRTANRHFQAFTTRMRLDVYNDQVQMAARLGRPLDDISKEELARGLNRISGIATNRAGDIETLTLFAPNFLRSSVESITAAVRDGGIEGQVARQYLRNLFGMTAMISVSWALANNRDPREVLQPFNLNALEKGNIALNPNFLTVRVGGQDVALLGRWDSLARLAFLAGDTAKGVISEQSAVPFGEALDYFYKTKGAPTLGIGRDLLTGRTFSGTETLSPLGAAEVTLPFAFSAWLTDYTETGNLLTSAVGSQINFLGGKANPVTPYERLQEAARVAFNKPLEELTSQERQQLDEMFPEVVAALRRRDVERAEGGDEKAQARLRKNDIENERIAEEAALGVAFTSGELSRPDYGDRISDLQRETALRKQEVDATLGIEHDDRSGNALSDWYRLYDLAKIPGTQIIDWDRYDELEAQFLALVADGEYGDPETTRRLVEERRKPTHPDPVAARFFEAKDYANLSGYYTVRDDEFARFASQAGRLGVASYQDLLRAINAAELGNDVARLRRLSALRRQVDRRVDRFREQLRRRDPQLEAALYILGRVSNINRRTEELLAGR